ncbi:hypothetical protein JNUCC0626_48660 [Lentzea sp. JNUCC 0626]|uniref:hypothetical protein n=1 Tax=Lentzea sp. JNUCC 0626 TaxID=3367513 RepID=UPI00374A5D94
MEIVACGSALVVWIGDRDWVACVLIVSLTIFGLFLLDHVWRMQSRENSLKAGLYTAATESPANSAGAPATAPPADQHSR